MVSLTKEEQDKVLKHIEVMWGEDAACPMCKNMSWKVFDEIFTLYNWNNSVFSTGGGNRIPLIPVMCNVCGNTVLINALLAKIVPREKLEFEPVKLKAQEMKYETRSD